MVVRCVRGMMREMYFLAFEQRELDRKCAPSVMHMRIGSIKSACEHVVV